MSADYSLPRLNNALVRCKHVHTVRDLTRSTLTKMSIQPEATAAGMKRSELFKTVLPAMKNYYETKNYIFVHGWIPSIANGIVSCLTSNSPWNLKLRGGLGSRFICVRQVVIFQHTEWRNDDAAGWYFARWYNGMLAAHQGVIEPGKTMSPRVVYSSWSKYFSLNLARYVLFRCCNDEYTETPFQH